jgi:anti-sigma regulatory factor (Ser/Thr protein kinase)
MQFVYKIEAGNFSKAGDASSSFRKVLKQLNVDPQLIKRIVISLYEGEVNIVAHSCGGKAICEIEKDKVVIYLMDDGPGIANIEQAMQAGFSTASAKVREMGFGAGMGLSNMKNNADLMEISSQIGLGTEVKITVNIR